MKRKILASLLLLSLSAVCAGCQPASRVENTVSDTSKNEVVNNTDTDSAKERTTDSEREKKQSSDNDTAVDKAESISSDDVKELESADKEKTYAPEPEAIQVGGITLEAEYIPFDDELKISDEDDMDGAVLGSTLYILDKKNLHSYTLSDGTLTANNTIKLTDKYDRVDADVFGNVYLSGKKLNVAMLNDDGTLNQLDFTGKLAMSKVMNFGLSCNGKDLIRKYADGEIEEWLLDNIDTDTTAEADTEVDSETDTAIKEEEAPRFTKVHDIEFAQNHILVGGHFNDGSDTLRAAVFDYEGNQTALTDNKISGDEVVSMTETSSGLIISSGSNLSLWTPDGTEIGQTKTGDIKKLFGTDEPVWINDVFTLDDGSVLVLCSGENKKDDDIAMLYRLYGM